MKSVSSFFLLVAFLVSIASGQEADPAFVKTFVAKTEKLRKSFELEVSKAEAAFAEEFKKLKEATLAEVESARKASTIKDDLKTALELVETAKEINGISWMSTKPAKIKKLEWEFTKNKENHLVKQPDSKWVESSDESLVWIEKQRTDVYIILHDPKRDIWARLYDDAIIWQFPTQRAENTWTLLEGKWVR